MQGYALVVIGAGSAGGWAAPYAARLGARVALVEQGRIGGDCTHYGCVPSKALLRAADVARSMRTAEQFGLEAVDRSEGVDLGRVMAAAHEAMERVYALETPEVLGRAGVDVLLGRATFVDRHSLMVGEHTRIRSRHFLICTGARSAVSAIDGLADTEYWTCETVWSQIHLPRRLLVLGSGPVGTELSQAFTRLGSTVTVFERGDRPLRVADPEASAVLRALLEEEGVRIRFGAHLESVRQQGPTVVVVDRGEPVEGDALLVAVGRRPTDEGLDLERAGVKYSERGIQVNGRLQTTQKNIYACGDVIGGFQYTHYAAWQASVAVRNIIFPGQSRAVRPHVPWTVFTDPEVAHCGLSEVEARKNLRPRTGVQVVRWELDHLDRAITDRSLNGFIKSDHSHRRHDPGSGHRQRADRRNSARVCAGYGSRPEAGRARLEHARLSHLRCWCAAARGRVPVARPGKQSIAQTSPAATPFWANVICPSAPNDDARGQLSDSCRQAAWRLSRWPLTAVTEKRGPDRRL